MILIDDCLISRKFPICVFHMSLLFCCYGSGVENKTYTKIKFNVRYIVSLFGFSVVQAVQLKSYETPNTTGLDLKKWVQASLKAFFKPMSTKFSHVLER